MTSRSPNWPENAQKKRPKMAQNGPKWPCLLGGLKEGPLSKNTILGSLHECTPRIRRFLEKSASFPPSGWPSGGKNQHFFPKIGENEGCILCKLPEKMVKRGGDPILGTFWGFWAFPVKTVCPTGLPGSASQQRKRYTCLLGSSQRSSRGSILHSLRV